MVPIATKSWIRIRIHLEKKDMDLHKNNADPENCLKQSASTIFKSAMILVLKSQANVYAISVFYNIFYSGCWP
jgi:hypothetical protein